MSIITIARCPVCGSDDLKKAFDAVDHFSSGEVFPVWNCVHCGFRFTNNFPSEDIVGRYYDSPDYISHSDSGKGLVNRLYHFFRKRMLRKKVRLVEAYAPQTESPLRLLDIGCGTGYFLREAAKRGWVVSGIEKDRKARESAARRTGIAVGDAQAFDGMGSGSFDVVTLWHVLEHMEKLNETVDKIREVLTPQGVAIIALPNCRSYDAGFYKERWAAYDIPRHLWHFSPETVEALLARHGMRIVKKMRMPLDAFYISLLSEKYRGSSLPVKYARAFVVGSIGFIRSWRDVKQSSSVVYIAKKTGGN